MKITKENKTTFFLNKEGVKHYAEGRSKIVEIFGKEFIKFLKDKNFKDGKILDMGSGTGYLAILLSDAFPDAEIVGVDYSDLMNEYAEDFVRKNNKSTRITFVKGDISNLPFEDNSFDALVSLNVLHYVDNMTGVLNEVQRIIKDNGHIAISDIRTSLMGLFLSPFRVTYPYKTFRKAFENSNLMNCTLKKGFFWIDIWSKK
ncbi:MAG: class I SAM-dependent methyltransferase [Bacteroidales bacterium]